MMIIDNGKFYYPEMSENNATHTFSTHTLCGLCYFPHKKKKKKCDSHYSLTFRGCKNGRERYSFAEGTMPQDLPAAEHPK